MLDLSKISSMYKSETPLDEIHAIYKDAIAQDFEKYKDKLIEYATEHADSRALQILFDAGVSPQILMRYGFTLLHLIAKRNQSRNTPENGVADCVNLLLDNRVSVMRKDEYGGLCCYHYAARDANLEFIRALHARGTNMKMTGKDGVTALHELAAGFQYNGANADRNPELVERYIEIAKILIDAGIDIDAKNDSGRSAADIVIEYKSVGLFRLLSSNPTVFQAIEIQAYDDIQELASINPNALSDNDGQSYKRGMSALGAACAKLDDRAVDLVFDAGADANFRDNDGNLGLVGFFYARPSNKILGTHVIGHILDAFVNSGWNVNYPIDGDGNTLLVRTIKSDFPSGGYNNLSVQGDILGWIWPHAPDVNVSNAKGQTALMFACMGQKDEMENVLISLLESDADITAKDSSGKTALHYLGAHRSQAKARNYAEIISSFGKLDINAVDNDGKTVLDIATENNNEELVKFLLTKV